jgi:1-acyl-sn-glycerol-3-phosphate acyltransferase
VPIKKQTTDMRAVINCVQIAKEGGTIAIAPEGNRTYSGKTEYIKHSIVKLARLTNLPIATFRITGGYGVHPRWSDKIRKGRVYAGVSRIIESCEYNALTDEQLYSLIKKELSVDETNSDSLYKSKRKAEFLERVFYVCRNCGFTTFKSRGNSIKCIKCGETIHYGEDKRIISTLKDFPFDYVNKWYEYQNEFVRKADLSQYEENPIYKDYVKVFKVILYKKKIKLAKNVKLCLYVNKIGFIKRNNSEKDKIEMRFENISTITVLGKNKLNIYYKDSLYQIKGEKRFNALKYVNIFYKYLNKKDDSNVQFLGL